MVIHAIHLCGSVHIIVIGREFIFFVVLLDYVRVLVKIYADMVYVCTTATLK